MPKQPPLNSSWRTFVVSEDELDAIEASLREALRVIPAGELLAPMKVSQGLQVVARIREENEDDGK